MKGLGHVFTSGVWTFIEVHPPRDSPGIEEGCRGVRVWR